jgi:flagellar hook-basal body complex protein FliE
MSHISGSTLVAAIQAVHSKMKDLETRLEAGDPEDADLETLLLSYEKAAAELRTAYEEALKTTSNLPAYQQLVRP